MFYIWYMLPNSIRTRIRPMLKIISANYANYQLKDKWL